MAIYRLDGTQISTAYRVNGEVLSSAYDIEGHDLIPADYDLVVMTYNVQWFTKINSQESMQNSIIGQYEPSIIGFQEFSNTGSIPSVGARVLADYPTITLSSHYNYNAIASKLGLSNTTTADFVAQSNEARSYIKTYFTFGGKTICWINTHLEYDNNTVQYAQAQEVLSMAEQEEYVIITGDFNSYGLSVDSADYIGIFKPFVDAGYNLSNSTSARGFTKTYTANTTGSSLADLTYPCDNIITSSNITIFNVVFNTTKFSYLDGNPIDHIPVIAYLKFN